MASGGSGWVEQDQRKMLHAVYRVGDIDATAEYYKKHFGMKQLRYRDIPEVGPPPRACSPVFVLRFLPPP